MCCYLSAQFQDQRVNSAVDIRIACEIWSLHKGADEEREFLRSDTTWIFMSVLKFPRNLTPPSSGQSRVATSLSGCLKSGDSKLVQNVHIYVPKDTGSYLTRLETWKLLFWTLSEFSATLVWRLCQTWHSNVTYLFNYVPSK